MLLHQVFANSMLMLLYYLILRKAGVGVVLRDEKGEVLMAMSKTEHELNEPESVELLVMLWGLQFTLYLGVSKAMLDHSD